MTAHHSLAATAALIGEPTRAAMLVALLDGRALPATELARVASLSAPATSMHLARLLQGGLLAVHQEGRHRYYRLARAEVAYALESLGVIATAAPPVRSLSVERSSLRDARTCYDHLAGAYSLALAEKLERASFLVPRDHRTYDVTSQGERWFGDVLQIDVSALTRARRPLARRCLDWTERKPHLAGALGAALLEGLLERRWLERIRGSRAVRITPRGQAGVERLPGLA